MTDKVRARRLKLAGHVRRHPEEAAHELVWWTPQHGNRKRGRPARTFVQQLEEDTELDAREMDVIMQDRKRWRSMVGRCIPDTSTR